MNAVLAIASTTLGEAIRRRVLLIILFIGLLLISIIPSLSVLSARSEQSTTISAMYAVLRFTSALIAIILTIYMIPNEIDRRTIYTILSKPVTRWQFLVGKYFGAVFAIGLMIVLMSSVMLILFAMFQHPPLERILEVARQPMMYFMEMCLLAAVAIFFSTFTTPLVNFFLSIGVWGVGTVLNPLYESVAQNSGTPGAMKLIANLITRVLPNFANFDVKNPLINPNQIIENETVFFIQVILQAVAYIAALLILGNVIFDRREV